MKKFCVYILKCSDESYYVGVTSNLRRRLREHWTAKNPKAYVSSRLPFEVAFVKNFTRALTAIAYEKQIKGWTRKKKEALIAGFTEGLHDLSICNNASHYLRRK